jgi:hypothetical protein
MTRDFLPSPGGHAVHAPIEKSAQGHPVVDNKVLPLDTGQQDNRLGRLDKEFATMEEWYHPFLETTLHEIGQEIQEMKFNGKLRPFTEGEPIGGLPRRVRQKPMSKAMIHIYHTERMERHRADMLAARKKNDLSMLEVLNG